MKRKYSLIIPCVNSLNAKRRSIELVVTQLLKQQYLNYEIICVTGGSNDGTEDFLKGYSKNINNFNVITVPYKPNRSHARNLGAERAEGDWLVFLDDDCLVLTENLFFVLDRSCESEFFAVGARRKWLPLCWESTMIRKALDKNSYEAIDSISIVPKGIKRKTGRRDLQEFSFLGHFGCVRKDIFEAEGGFDENYTGWGFEDTDLMMRLYSRLRSYFNLYEHLDVYHLTHLVQKEDIAQRGINIQRYYEKEKSLGVRFYVNRFFGVYDDCPNGAILEKQ